MQWSRYFTSKKIEDIMLGNVTLDIGHKFIKVVYDSILKYSSGRINNMNLVF